MKTIKNHIPRVLECFGLRPPFKLGLIRRGSAGRKYQVTCESGRYLLRVLTPPRPRFLDFAVLAQSTVAENLKAAPVLLRNRDDDLFLVYEGATWIVEVFVDGIPRQVSENDVFQCGRSLAEIHECISGLSNKNDVAYAWGCLDGMAYAHVRNHAKLVNQFRCSPKDDFCVHWETAARQASEYVKSGVFATGTHGDVNPTNLLWCANSFVFSDFINAAPLPQVVDLSMGLIGFGLLAWDYETGLEVLPSDLHFNDAIAHALFRGYRSVRPINSGDRQALINMFIVILGFWLEWFPFRDVEHKRTVLMQAADLARTAKSKILRLFD